MPTAPWDGSRCFHGEIGDRPRRPCRRTPLPAGNLFRLTPVDPAAFVGRDETAMSSPIGGKNGRQEGSLPRRPELSCGHRGPVAQLDRALPSEGRGHEFESRRVRQRTSYMKTIIRPGSQPRGRRNGPAEWRVFDTRVLAAFRPPRIGRGLIWPSAAQPPPKAAPAKTAAALCLVDHRCLRVPAMQRRRRGRS